MLALASSSPSEILKELKPANDPDSGLRYLLGAVAVTVILVLVWAIFIRKRRNERARAYKYPTVSAVSDLRKPSGKRRKRRHSRPLNPTRAETGGLPPLRREMPAGDPP